jgi:predicted DCC family thiol-disulfide oxidoreductase YuxK
MPVNDPISVPASDTHPKQGWVLYDGDCGICIQLIRWIEPTIIHYGFTTLPLQTPWVKEKLGLTTADQQSELLKEMRVLTTQGQVYGGADALLAMAKRIWWVFPLYGLTFFPGIKPLLRKSYYWVAERRHCSAQGCKISKG